MPIKYFVAQRATHPKQCTHGRACFLAALCMKACDALYTYYIYIYISIYLSLSLYIYIYIYRYRYYVSYAAATPGVRRRLAVDRGGGPNT